MSSHEHAEPLVPATPWPPEVHQTASKGAVSARGAKLNGLRLVRFSTLAVPVFAMQVPLSAYLPAILTRSYGLSLATVGLVFLLAKSWGVLTDPLIGTLSDQTHSSFGRRRSWILGGGIAFGLAILALFFPPSNIAPLYLGLALFVLYLAWSMIQIPYFAWSGEIAADYQERTRVVTYQAVSGAVGLLLVLTAPTVTDRLYPGNGALELHAMGGILLVTLLLGLILTLRAFPESPASGSKVSSTTSPSLALRLILTNPLLMRVLAADFSMTLGQMTRGALFVFFVTSYMRLPAWSSGLFLLQFIFGITAGPIWMLISRRLGKHRTVITAEITQMLINLGLLFVVPGGLPLLLGLTIAQGLSQGSGNLMLQAMVADVADEHRLRTHEDRKALFFSVFSISSKASMAAAVGIALPFVAWLGFDPHANSNSPQALHGLQLTFALAPATLHAIAALLIRGFPLDAEAHAAVRRKLAERDAGREADPALS
jgi:GPH family glycoside/pentoside/hexuronide:cation symporter